MPTCTQGAHAIVATSTDAERAFSRGRLTVSRLRHSLSDASVRANTVLGSWARIDDLVPEKETIDFLGDKKRARAARAGDDVASDGPEGDSEAAEVEFVSSDPE